MIDKTKLLPRIESLPEKTLVGKSIRMCLANNKTHELWSSFMPNRNEVTNKVGSSYYSVQFYDANLQFENFTPQVEFTKCAMVEVSEVGDIPEGMETRKLPEGLYAVFTYVGRPMDFAPTWRYIFQEWLPNSIYTLDDRPHFELLPENYNPMDPNAQEEVWIPIKEKE